MKLSKQKRKTSVSMNMTSMIDIVFLLLIFFMTVSQVSETKKHRVNLPKIAKGGEEQQPSQLVINIDAQGKIFVLGRVMTLGELTAEVGEQILQVGNQPLLLTVTLRADAQVKSQTVNEVVRRLDVLGIQHVHVGVEQSQ